MFGVLDRVIISDDGAVTDKNLRGQLGVVTYVGEGEKIGVKLDSGAVIQIAPHLLHLKESY